MPMRILVQEALTRSEFFKKVIGPANVDMVEMVHKNRITTDTCDYVVSSSGPSDKFLSSYSFHIEEERFGAAGAFILFAFSSNGETSMWVLDSPTFEMHSCMGKTGRRLTICSANSDLHPLEGHVTYHQLKDYYKLTQYSAFDLSVIKARISDRLKSKQVRCEAQEKRLQAQSSQKTTVPEQTEIQWVMQQDITQPQTTTRVDRRVDAIFTQTSKPLITTELPKQENITEWSAYHACSVYLGLMRVSLKSTKISETCLLSALLTGVEAVIDKELKTIEDNL